MPKITWNEETIRELVSKHFGKHACWFQIQVALALHAGNDVVGKAPTGMGKTLSFFIALLMALAEDPDSNARIIIVTPLNLLGKQNVKMLKDADLKAIAISAENNNDRTFEVRGYALLKIKTSVFIICIGNMCLPSDCRQSRDPYGSLWKISEAMKEIRIYTKHPAFCT